MKPSFGGEKEELFFLFVSKRCFQNENCFLTSLCAKFWVLSVRVRTLCDICKEKVGAG